MLLYITVCNHERSYRILSTYVRTTSPRLLSPQSIILTEFRIILHSLVIVQGVLKLV